MHEFSQEEYEQYTEMYKKRIQTFEDLIKFATHHMMSGTTMDAAAIRAVEERGAEIFVSLEREGEKFSADDNKER